MRLEGYRTVETLKNEMTYDHVWPEETCPVCGKKWTRFCRRNEWGYWYNNSESQLTSNLTLLCSAECSKKFAEQKLMDSVRKTAKSKCAKVIRLIEEQHMTRQQASRIVGKSPDGSIDGFMMTRWKELQWLRDHNWEVPE